MLDIIYLIDVHVKRADQLTKELINDTEAVTRGIMVIMRVCRSSILCLLPMRFPIGYKSISDSFHQKMVSHFCNRDSLSNGIPQEDEVT